MQSSDFIYPPAENRSQYDVLKFSHATHMSNALNILDDNGWASFNPSDYQATKKVTVKQKLDGNSLIWFSAVPSVQKFDPLLSTQTYEKLTQHSLFGGVVFEIWPSYNNENEPYFPFLENCHFRGIGTEKYTREYSHVILAQKHTSKDRSVHIDPNLGPFTIPYTMSKNNAPFFKVSLSPVLGVKEYENPEICINCQLPIHVPAQNLRIRFTSHHEHCLHRSDTGNNYLGNCDAEEYRESNTRAEVAALFLLRLCARQSLRNEQFPVSELFDEETQIEMKDGLTSLFHRYLNNEFSQDSILKQIFEEMSPRRYSYIQDDLTVNMVISWISDRIPSFPIRAAFK